jgi:predicted TIM-barrel fold metal-dependent hydrolase
MRHHAPGQHGSASRWDRRRLLTALAATLAAPALRSAHAGQKAQDAPTTRPARLVDVHHHLFLPAMQAALKSVLSPFQLADVQRSLAEMRAGGTATAIISYPNDTITRLPAPRLTALLRQTNDEAAALVQQRPHTYGLFASLPMPYVTESLRELAHAYDDLHVDGILLLTSYGDRWLGHPSFAPVLEELNRRRAVVFVHPITPMCCGTLLPPLNPSVIEFETDTARTIADLIFTGSIDRFPDIRWLFSHAGGTMPSLIERFDTATNSSPKIRGHFTQPPRHYLRGFYFDTAQAANPVALGALLGIVAPSQLLFGTDFPYRTAAQQSDALRAMPLLQGALPGILRDNARRLLPRLQSAQPA